MAYLRRAGLTVELIPDHLVDDIADRLAFTEYWQAKRRELRASYRCEPVIVWSGDDGTWRDLL